MYSNVPVELEHKLDKNIYKNTKTINHSMRIFKEDEEFITRLANYHGSKKLAIRALILMAQGVIPYHNS